MPQIVSIILIVGIFFVIGSAHYLFTRLWNLESVKEVLRQTRNDLVGPAEKPGDKIAQWIEPVIENPEGAIDTIIISGPRNNEKVTDSQVTFRFRARVYSENITGNIVFETKVSGIDSDWKETSLNSRTIKLNPETKKYTFYVRAKSGAYLDATPAQRSFTAQLSY